MKRTLLYWFTTAILFAVASTLSAATYTWTGAGFMGTQDYLWSNPFNWAGAGAPQAGEANVIIVLPNTGAPRTTTNDIAGLVVKQIRFEGDNYVLGGKSPGGSIALTFDELVGDTLDATGNNGSLAASLSLSLNSGIFVEVASTKTLHVRASMTGTGGLTKRGSGALHFNSPGNGYTGTTRILDGTVDLECGLFGPNTAIAGSVIIGEANSPFSPIVRLLNDDQFADLAPISIHRGGKLYLNGHNDTVGPLTMLGGFVNTGLGAGSSSPGILGLNGNMTNRFSELGDTSILRGKIHLGSTTRIFHVETNSHLAIPASISGSVIHNPGITKTGGGQLSLYDGTNTYGGVTLVSQGVLHLAGDTQLLGSTNVGTTVSAGAKLVVHAVNILGEPLSLNGTVSPATLTFYDQNTWAGTVNVTGDIILNSSEGADTELILFDAITGPGSIRQVAPGRLRLRGSAPNTFSGGFHVENGNVHLEKAAGADAFGGPLSIGRTEDDGSSARVVISYKDNIPDAMPVTIHLTGFLEATSSDNVGSITFEGGDLYSDAGALTVVGNVTNRFAAEPGRMRGRINLSPGLHIFYCEELSQLNVSGVLQGLGSITKMGTISSLTFLNTNSYSGLTHVAEGDLILEGMGRPGSAASGTLVSASAFLQLRGVAVTNETLIIEPSSPNGADRNLMFVQRTNRWVGPVVLNAPIEIQASSSSELVFDGPISGPGSVSFVRELGYPTDASLVFAGPEANTYTGDTFLKAGTLVLSKPGATAIPGNLIAGFPTNGSPAASIICKKSSQFSLANDAMLHLTLNPSAALHCGGFPQFVANLKMRGGAVFTEGGSVLLRRDWTVLANTNASGSIFFGDLWLASPFAFNTHSFDIATNATAQLWGNITQGAAVANVRKLGGGELAMLGSNSFDGTFTLANGRVIATGVKPFGTEAGPTLVKSGATLLTLTGTNAEPFTLEGHGYTNQGALVVDGLTRFNGPVILSADTDIITPDATSEARFGGQISGPGGLTKLGQGLLRFSGTESNVYTGSTRLSEGMIYLAKNNATAVPGAFTVGQSTGVAAIVRWFASDQIADTSAMFIDASGQAELQDHNEAVGSISGSGNLFPGNGTITNGGDGTSTIFAGLIAGNGGKLVKTGVGTLTLTGNNLYTGGSIVQQGQLLVNGQQPFSPVTLLTGGQLGGVGRVGAISAQNGHVAPGIAGAGRLASGNFSFFSPSSVLKVDLNGNSPGAGYDQVEASGSVLLMGGSLQLSMNFPGAVSNQYVIVKNLGPDLVTGTFTGLPNLSRITNNGTVFVIQYDGGDGNDVVLIQQNIGSAPQVGGIQSAGPGKMQLSGTGIPGMTYSVEATESLAEPIAWDVIGSVKADTAGALGFLDEQAGDYQMRFYRFRLP